MKSREDSATLEVVRSGHLQARDRFPSVSVVIPVRNRSVFLAEAVQSALHQDQKPLEVIVVDDGSTEDISGTIGSFGDAVRIIRQEHEGRSRARNRGVDAARGEIVAFLDSDDRWLPDKLSRQLAILSSNPDLGFVCGFVNVIDGQGISDEAFTERLRRTLARTSASKFRLERLVLAPGVYTSTLLIPKRVLLQVGIFEKSLEPLEDLDLMVRIRRQYVVAGVAWPPVAEYRVHSNNSESEAMAKASVLVTERHLIVNGSERGVRAALLLRKAQAERQLVAQENARRSAFLAFAAAPAKTTRWGGLRLLAGSLMPSRFATAVAAGRRNIKTPPERIDPERESPGIVAHHSAKYHFAAALLGEGLVLDVGCGFGYGVAKLAHRSRLVVGVDLSSESIAAAHTRYKRPGIGFARMDAQQLGFRSESFDLVLCFEAIEHLTEPERHLEEVTRVLRHQGIYIVSTPQPSLVRAGALNPYHQHEFTYESFRGMLETHFGDVEVVGQRREQSSAHRFLRRADVLALRKWTLLRPLARLATRMLGSRATEDALLSDFKIDKEGLVAGSEFVGICRLPLPSSLQ